MHLVADQVDNIFPSVYADKELSNTITNLDRKILLF